MLFAVYYVVPVLIVVAIINRRRVNNVDLDFQYRFYRLRDELRSLVINKKIDRNDPSFILLDEKITMASGSFSRMNIILLLYAITFVKLDSDKVPTLTFAKNKKYKNSGLLVDINERYNNMFYKYLLRKYIYLLFVILLPIWFVKRFVKVFLNSNPDALFARLTQKIKRKVSVLGGAISYDFA